MASQECPPPITGRRAETGIYAALASALRPITREKRTARCGGFSGSRALIRTHSLVDKRLRGFIRLHRRRYVATLIEPDVFHSVGYHTPAGHHRRAPHRRRTALCLRKAGSCASSPHAATWNAFGFTIAAICTLTRPMPDDRALERVKASRSAAEAAR